jgi:hypothetical protein
MKNQDSKYILCRPEGGINDVFCQIQNCFQYAISHQRILLVDTHSTGFHEPIGNYFISKAENLVFLKENEADIYFQKATSIYPSLTGSILGYKPVYKESHNFCNELDGKTLSFDFQKGYEHQLLLHHACGGGTSSNSLFNYLTLSDVLKEKIVSLFLKIPKPYCSIHIRNTDLKTNYKEIFRNPFSFKHIFLATDSKETLEYAKTECYEHKIFNFSTKLSSNDIPIHMHSINNPNSLDRSTINTEAFIDLFLLGLGQQFVALPTQQGYYSGFTLLANFLFQNKKLLYQLLELDTESKINWQTT